MTDPIRAALSQPEPAGLSDEELLQIAAKTINPYEDCGIGIDEYEAETECAVEAYGSELIAFARAVEAATLARAQRQPVPPEQGEVQELVRVLHQAADNDEWDGASPEWCASLTRAADLLAQRYPQPVPVSERLPGPEDCDAEGRCWCFTPRLVFEGQLIFHSRWILSVPMEADTHWLPAPALPLPVEVEE